MSMSLPVTWCFMSTTSDLPTLSPTDAVFTDYEAGKIRMHAIFFNKRILGDTFITLAKIDGPFERAPETGLGALDNLPAETLMEIVRQLDLNSIWRLREVSVAVRDLVHSSSDYRALRKERVLADAIRTSNLGHKIKLQMFAYLVRNKKCEICGEPGE